MKWKNVLRLISVDIKSGRLIRGQRLRKYRESRVLQYVMYGGGCLLGIVVGLFAGVYYNMIKGTVMEADFLLGAKGLFIAAPTLVLTYILIFTMMNQMQRSGIQLSIQPPYWLPITWGEHTLASILANLIGIQLAALIFIVSAISVVSVFIGEVPLAALTIFAILAIAFLASATTEIFRVLQVRLTGAVYKSSGRAAIWVRFFGSIILIVVFFLVYFFFVSGANYAAILGSFASGQKTLWFIPYIWLGMALFSFTNGQILETVFFSLGSVIFLFVLFLVAVRLNRIFGLYEPPAIRISLGAYTPKAGIWRRLGFSSSEAAMMRKDFKALTRRRELMFLFVLPIVIIISMIMSLTQTGQSGATVPQTHLFTFALIFLMPGAFVAVMLGSMMIGEEGAPVWHLYSSPITAESLIKCKYAFIVIFSCAVTLACGIVSILVFHPSVRMIFAGLIESIFLIVSISAVSLLIGIKGADFNEVPRPRMIRPLELFINLFICLILSIAILAPLIAYVGVMMVPPNSLSHFYLYIALAISCAIATTVTYSFYRIDVKNAKDFLAKAEI